MAPLKRKKLHLDSVEAYTCMCVAASCSCTECNCATKCTQGTLEHYQGISNDTFANSHYANLHLINGLQALQM